MNEAESMLSSGALFEISSFLILLQKDAPDVIDASF